VTLQNDGELKAGDVAGMLEGTANSYRLVLGARSRVGFAADSTEIDPMVTITGPGTAVGDDDSGDGTNARLVTTLDAGTYTVAIDDVGDADAGLYTLRTEIAPATGGALRIRAGAGADGALVAAEQHRYAFTVDRAGTYVIAMSSSDLDSIVDVVRNGEVVETNDDASEDDTNARLEIALEPGEYQIVARSYESGAGRYHLQVDRR
jgi:hypothetical protein